MKSVLKISILLVVCSMGIYGSNGAKLSSGTARGEGMGGAEIAITEEVSSSASNPASLAFIERSRLDFDLGVIIPKASIRSKNDRIEYTTTPLYLPLPSISYAHKVNSNLVLDISLMTEGGLGIEYERNISGDLEGAKFGTELIYATLNFTASYLINEKWSVGVTPYLSYSYMGLQGGNIILLKGMEANGYGIKLGTIYKITDKWNVGAKYTTEDKLKYTGTATSKLNDKVGTGENNAKTEIAWPAELVIGTTYKVTEKLLLAADIKWLNWSSAMDRMDIEIDSIKKVVNLDWKDQMVYAVGAEYRVTPKVKLRVGYNIAPDNTPDTYKNSLLTVVTTHHITAGIGYEITENLEINGAIEYALNATKKIEGPLGFGEIERNTGLTIITGGISYKF